MTYRNIFKNCDVSSLLYIATYNLLILLQVHKFIFSCTIYSFTVSVLLVTTCIEQCFLSSFLLSRRSCLKLELPVNI